MKHERDSVKDVTLPLDRRVALPITTMTTPAHRRISGRICLNWDGTPTLSAYFFITSRRLLRADLNLYWSDLTDVTRTTVAKTTPVGMINQRCWCNPRRALSDRSGEPPVSSRSDTRLLWPSEVQSGGQLLGNHQFPGERRASNYVNPTHASRRFNRGCR